MVRPLNQHTTQILQALQTLLCPSRPFSVHTHIHVCTCMCGMYTYQDEYGYLFLLVYTKGIIPYIICACFHSQIYYIPFNNHEHFYCKEKKTLDKNSRTPHKLFTNLSIFTPNFRVLIQ